jgi:hypothetical protein
MNYFNFLKKNPHAEPTRNEKWFAKDLNGHEIKCRLPMLSCSSKNKKKHEIRLGTAAREDHNT